MIVSLPADLEEFVRAELAAGRASSIEEMITAALRLYREEVETMRALVQPALESLDRGEGRSAQEVFADLERRYSLDEAYS